jgi:hypothetical protein
LNVTLGEDGIMEYLVRRWIEAPPNRREIARTVVLEFQALRNKYGIKLGKRRRRR